MSYYYPFPNYSIYFDTFRNGDIETIVSYDLSKMSNQMLSAGFNLCILNNNVSNETKMEMMNLLFTHRPNFYKQFVAFMYRKLDHMTIKFINLINWKMTFFCDCVSNLNKENKDTIIYMLLNYRHIILEEIYNENRSKVLFSLLSRCFCYGIEYIEIIETLCKNYKEYYLEEHKTFVDFFREIDNCAIEIQKLVFENLLINSLSIIYDPSIIIDETHECFEHSYGKCLTSCNHSICKECLFMSREHTCTCPVCNIPLYIIYCNVLQHRYVAYHF